ncbi:MULTISPECIES: hypothetical protein [Olivibacter]|uniref:Subunit length determinant protein n=1 Tax=Olivibacter jilunii TaxID=985016 RepID=A0ABW6BA13_9SPHI|nr:hypothetical protein [Olivibacter sp. UJ_SKK_5.1]
MLFVGKYRRSLAILKESVAECCSPNKGWLPLAACIFLIVLVLSVLAKIDQQKLPAEENELTGLTILKRLENDLAKENAVIHQFDSKIVALLDSIEATKLLVKHTQTKKFSKLWRSKLQTIKNYTEIPIFQFNQIPTFPTDNRSLDSLIIFYNQLHTERAKTQAADSESGVSLSQTLIQVRLAILTSLDSMLRLSPPGHNYPLSPSLINRLNSLLKSRDEAANRYELMLHQYQSSFDQLPKQLVTSIELTEAKPLKPLTNRNLSRSPFRFAVISFLLSLLISLLIIYYKKYRFPFVLRTADLTSNDQAHFHVWTDIDSKRNLLNLIKSNSWSAGTIVNITALTYSSYPKELQENLIEPLLKTGVRVVLIHLAPMGDELEVYKDRKFLQDYVRDPSVHIEEIVHRDRALPLDHIFFSPPSLKAKQENSLLVSDDSYWSLQRSLLSERFKFLLQVLKNDHYYVLILQPPPIDPVYFPLYLSCSDMYLNIFKYNACNRRSAEKIARQGAGQDKKTINILDKSTIYKQLNQRKHEKNSH